MDLVDQLIGDLRQENCVFCRLVAHEPWRIQKSESPAAPFYAVLSGRMRVVTSQNAFTLYENDFLVMPRGDAHEFMGLASEAAEPIELLSLFEQNLISPWRPGMRYRAVRLAYGGEGAETVFLVGLFYFGEPGRNPLLSALPAALVMRATAEGSKAWLRDTVSAIEAELYSDRPGASMVVAKHADLLFSQAVRGYLESAASDFAAGWLRGMADPTIGRALTAMHREPERAWTLLVLAREANCSRAVFARRFKEQVGQGAMGYLTSWRMQVAAHHLRNGSESIGEVARKVGYRADAFANAFSRWAGVSPRRYRTESLNLQS